ncbi:MAG TPA: hybrid sensor histidine kinase/response regulator [Burkholderiales bacterium]
MNPSAGRSDFMIVDEAIAREQAMLVHGNLPTGVIGGFLVACLLMSAFWDAAAHEWLLLWIGAGAVVGVFRLYYHGAYDPATASPEASRRWLRRAVIGALFSGSLWGIGAPLFFGPPEFLYHLLFVFAVAMMGITAMFSFSSHVPTFLAFFLPSSGAAVIGVASRGTLLHFYIALGMAIYMAVTLRFYVSFNRIFIRSVKLGFENVDLVGQLTVQKEAAESANLAKSRFLAAASHDLRQPMHALTMYLGAMEGQGLEGPARSNLANARQCAQTMDEMFRALLDISRLDAGAVRVEPRRLALQPLFERLAVEFHPQAEERGLLFKVMPTIHVIDSDPDAVERILRNFITNAIHYTERGRILVGARLHGRHLRIAVYDTGIGIEPAERGRIFEEFYQVGNPERDRSKGIGLGLAIVERLARLLEAPLTVQSQPGRGSMFAVDLPLAAGPAQPAPAPAEAPQGDLTGLMVVVVDDEEEILEATRAVLTQWGCEVIVATSGAAALAALVDSPRAPDVLICDFRLRDQETGIDVIEALRNEFNTDIPALLASGDSAPVRMREAEANGVPVLHKPFNEQSLRTVLLQVLAASRAQSAV